MTAAVRGPLSEGVLRLAARAMASDFGYYLARYDEAKYPPQILERLRLLFSRPDWFRPEDVELALRWKFGHLGKEDYPSTQRALARKIAGLWPEHRIRADESPQEVMVRWREFVGSTSFITICFLLHLVAPDEWPILDQHNFRAVQRLLADRRRTLAAKARPSTADDLVLVRDFVAGVRHVWVRVNRRPAPSAAAVDRYLMMFGKALKARDVVRSKRDIE